MIPPRGKSGEESTKIPADLSKFHCWPGSTSDLMNKFFVLSNYTRKIRLLVAEFLLNLGIPLVNSVSVDGFLIKFRASTFLEYFLRAEESWSREQVTMHWIHDCVSGGDVVIDIGANVGAYSLLLGKKLEQGGGLVYAIEAEAGNFKSLSENIHLNKLSGTVIPFCFAVGDARRVGKFFLSSTEPGSSMHALDRPVSDGVRFKEQHVQGVLVESVDSLIEHPGIMFPTHIKIDVDGLEGMIVENMSRTLADPRLETIMIEVEVEISAGQIETALESHGFVETMRERMAGREIFNILYERSPTK